MFARKISYSKMLKQLVIAVEFSCLFTQNWCTGSSPVNRRVENKIYVKLVNNSQCFRVLNGTHQVGCQSSRFGNTGVIHLVDDSAGVDWIVKDEWKHAPFVVALTWKAWTNEKIIAELESSGKVSGMIVLFDASRDLKYGGYSADDSCPNREQGSEDRYCEYRWNKYGHGRWFRDWKFPVFLLEDPNEIRIITLCYQLYNKPVNGVAQSYPLCSATLLFWMLAAVDSPTCLRRQKQFDGLDFSSTAGSTKKLCAPLHGYSIFNLIPSTERNNTNNEARFTEESTLILASRMDSFSMFSDVAPGAQSACSSLIALLAVAEALGRDREEYESLKEAALKNKKQLLIALLNGESMDYVGSSRLIFNMSHGSFPFYEDSSVKQPQVLLLKHIGFFLELNQLALSAEGNYFAHVDGKVYGKRRPEVDKVIRKLNISGHIHLASTNHSSLLPPSSYQRFLLKNPELPGLVLTDFQNTQFNSRFYNGLADRREQFAGSDRVRINGIAVVAEAVLEVAVDWLGKYPLNNFTIDRTMVKDLYDCFIGGMIVDCELHRRSTGSSVVVVDRPPTSFNGTELMDLAKSKPQKLTYIGPWGYYSPVQWTANYLMKTFFAVRTNISKDDCHSSNQKDFLHSYLWIFDLPRRSNDTFCGKTDAFLNQAESPAFLQDDYDWRSGEYSTWTESLWYGPSERVNVVLRVFLIPDPLWESLMFFVGLVTLLVSFSLIYFAKKYSEVLFPQTDGLL